METLANLPGVRQPAQCSLLVHPGQGWAIATEQPNGPGLAQCHLTLATKICQDYGIQPETLSLFTRYAHGDTNMYAVRFETGERDLFEAVRFMGARREWLHPQEAAALVEALAEGQAPAPAWRAVRVATPSGKAK